MMTIDVIRAWKDEDYRRSLSAEQVAQLPANPAGGIEVRQSDRSSFDNGRRTQNTNFRCCFGTRGCTLLQCY